MNELRAIVILYRGREAEKDEIQMLGEVLTLKSNITFPEMMQIKTLDSNDIAKGATDAFVTMLADNKEEPYLKACLYISKRYQTEISKNGLELTTTLTRDVVKSRFALQYGGCQYDKSLLNAIEIIANTAKEDPIVEIGEKKYGINENIRIIIRAIYMPI